MITKFPCGAALEKIFIFLVASAAIVLSSNARIGNAHDSYADHQHKKQLLSGRVTSIFESGIIQIRTMHGVIEEIEVTPNTIITPNGMHMSGGTPDSLINPNGLGLKPGMKITVTGSRLGNVFSAETLHVSYY